MKKILIATHNPNKLKEFRTLLTPFGFDVVSASDVCLPDVEETGTTFSENSLLKARFGFAQTGLPTIADDSGLCIHALDNAPGLFSARFAAKHGGYPAVFMTLWDQLSGQGNKSAHFHCAIAYVDETGDHVFEGDVFGTIADTADDSLDKFGYDPIFMPDGYDKTFGALPAEVKNQISHRARALEKLRAFFEQ